MGNFNAHSVQWCGLMGNFNAHSAQWWPDGDSNNEGTQLDILFSELGLTQMISEPTHFREHCHPSCIDLIICDQPNLVIASGARPSLDNTCKQQITFCKLSIRTPIIPPFKRLVWFYDKANRELIKRAMTAVQWGLLLNKNLITKNQSGFRPGDSVTNQLIILVDKIHSSLDINLEVRSVFLDMSKAFDKVWHEGLLFKLRQNGINGKLINLLKSYLSNRKQRVLINGSESDWGEIESGVPRSVLGPLLFLVYTNDLEIGIKSHIKFFADDTSLFSIRS